MLKNNQENSTGLWYLRVEDTEDPDFEIKIPSVSIQLKDDISVLHEFKTATISIDGRQENIVRNILKWFNERHLVQSCYLDLISDEGSLESLHLNHVEIGMVMEDNLKEDFDFEFSIRFDEVKTLD